MFGNAHAYMRKANRARYNAAVCPLNGFTSFVVLVESSKINRFWKYKITFCR